MIKGSHLTRTFIRQNGKKTEPFDAVSDVSLEPDPARYWEYLVLTEPARPRFFGCLGI